MTHGRPDWNLTNTNNIAYGSDDMGENAARLGSPSVHDRRGDVVWYDDCEGTVVRWPTALVGAGSAVAQTTANQYRGDKAYRLTAGAVAGSSAQIYRRMPLPPTTRLGLESAHSYTINTLSYAMEMIFQTATTTYTTGVKVLNNGTLQYWNAAGAWTTFATRPWGGAFIQVWDILKFVIDTDTGEYVRCIYSDQEYDMSGLRYQTAAAAIRQYLIPRCTAYGQAAGASTVDVDNIILTQNEP